MDELLGDLPEVSRLLFIYLFIHSFIYFITHEAAKTDTDEHTEPDTLRAVPQCASSNTTLRRTIHRTIRNRNKH